jgi:hypothetical protein
MNLNTISLPAKPRPTNNQWGIAVGKDIVFVYQYPYDTDKKIKRGIKIGVWLANIESRFCFQYFEKNFPIYLQILNL